jgi:hypothetical protein
MEDLLTSDRSGRDEYFISGKYPDYPLLRAQSKRDGLHRGAALESRNLCVVTKVLGMGEDGPKEMSEQVIRKKICAGRYTCKWRPDANWYVPAAQMPSSWATFCPFS